MTARLAVLILGAGIVAAGLGFAAAIRSGPSLPSDGATVVVREGEHLAAIAERLASAGVIRSALLFRAWARLTGSDRTLQPGRYRFERAVDVPVVLRTLATGVPHPDVTVPEGLTVREIALLLQSRGLVEVDEVVCLASDPEFLLAAGVPGTQLEGYLFPDTYRFAAELSTREILESMVRRFHERFDVARYRRAAARRLSVNQVVTLASIIEKETGLATERPLIAAVFTNRLRLGMPLQSDPTVIYAIPDFTGNLTRADLARPSPYNTYVSGGLPPGPIANPGLAALDAAMAPADSSALYFVSRNDGSHEFSATLAEHNRAVSRYQRSAPH
jgi:UPF0755 protein